MEKRGRTLVLTGVIFGLVFLAVLFFFLVKVEAIKTASLQNVTVTTWTNGSLSRQNLTNGTTHAKQISDWNFYFYSNFTNSSNAVLNSTIGASNCSIRFNITGSFGSFSPMTFSQGSLLWVYNRSFSNKGNLSFQTNCTSTYGNITNLTDSFIVLNTQPDSFPGAVSILFHEDNLSESFNASTYFIDDDGNDVITYNITYINSTKYSSTNPGFYTWITLNSSTGVLTHNSTNDTLDDIYHIKIQAIDTGNLGFQPLSATKEDFTLNISVTNDVPYFLNLNSSINLTSFTSFSLIVPAVDEENNVPLVFNVSFLSCIHTAPNPPTGVGNCTLFNLTSFNQTATNISFSPNRNQKGSYLANISVNDSLGNINSTLVTFNLTWTDIPTFTYVCDNERNTTQDVIFRCWVNATDNSLINLTFFANETWFKFNSTNSNNFSTAGNGGNYSALVNFTASDSQVGNWSINISISDLASVPAINSTVIRFFIGYANKSVSIGSLSPLTSFTSNNYTLTLNASDNNLLIPDKSVYNESLIFSSNDSIVSFQSYTTSGNVTSTQILVSSAGSSAGLHRINISVRDANNYSIASTIFNVTVIGNNAPEWNSTFVRNFNYSENNNIFLNLSRNVTDSNSDNITFSYSSSNSFPSFSLNSSTGIINFTASDEDVGLHVLTLIASDNSSNSTITVNFTISNVNDNPFLETSFIVINASVDGSGTHISANEDDLIQLSFFVQDNDFLINSTQKSFYNESLSISLSVSAPEGANASLINFTRNPIFPYPPTSLNRSRYDATFLPKKNDTGFYHVVMNISDFSGLSTTYVFNVTILPINHGPSIVSMSNQTSYIGGNLVVDINSNDIEDGFDTSGNMTYNITFLNGSNFIIANSSVFNRTSGIINIVFNNTQSGSYRLNVTVNDSSGFNSSSTFWIFVYNTPSISGPLPNYIFNLSEGNQSSISLFYANDSIGTNLTYQFYINNILRSNFSSFGNGTNITWQFTPNYNDETYGGTRNLTVIALNSLYSNLNSSGSWVVNISHAFSPINFTNNISDQSADVGSTITLNLSDYFTSADGVDPVYNQSINFTFNSNVNSSLYSLNISSFIMTISSSSGLTISGNISANDSRYAVISNNFAIQFTTPGSSSSSSSGGGGGGGGGSTSQASLRIIVPSPLTANKNDSFAVPISLINTGSVTLSNINVAPTVLRNGIAATGIYVSFDRYNIGSIIPSALQNFTALLKINAQEEGTYEIKINANSLSPSYSTSNSFYVEVNSTKRATTDLIYAREFILGNPECLELKEMIDTAQAYFDGGDYNNAQATLENAVNACNEAISGTKTSPGLQINGVNLSSLSITFASALALSIVGGILYYNYKRIRLRRAILTR